MKRINKCLVFFIIAAMFLSIAIPAQKVSANIDSGTVIPDGEYSVSYRYVKDGTSESSAADSFMVKDSGKLIIVNGDAVFEHEVEKANYKTFAYLAARKAGSAKAVIKTENGETFVNGLDGYEEAEVRDAENPNHVVVSYKLEDVWKKQDIVMHINDTENYFGLPMIYNHWYNAQLDISVSEIKLPEAPVEEEEEEEEPIHSVDKSQLIQWIEEATAWIEGKLDGAERENGVPQDIRAYPVSDGEYLPVEFFGDVYKGPVAKVKEQIQLAQLVVDDVKATQDEVNEAINAAKYVSSYEQYEKQRLVASDIEIIVLDSLEADAKISEYAGEISTQAVLLQQEGPGYYQAFANFAFYDTDNQLTDGSVRTVSASAADGFFSRWAGTAARAVKQPDLTNTPVFSEVLSGEHSSTVKVYQSEVRSGNRTYLQTDELWQGLWKLQYPMELPEEERKTVFISFNKSYLDELNERIGSAKTLLESAVEGTEVGQHSALQIEQLKVAIATAEQTGEQLSAARPKIIEATDTLQLAIDRFQAAAVTNTYWTAADSTEAEFSRFNDFISNQAQIVTQHNGKLQISLKLTNSSKVSAVKVKVGDEFVDTTVASEDKAANERTVIFEIDQLTGLIDAQAQVVEEKQDPQLYNLRININDVNNDSLYKLIKEATSAYHASLQSNKKGEYIELAQKALQQAIVLANEEAVRIPSEQTQTDEAYTRLSSAFDTFKQTVGSGGSSNPGTGNPGTSNPGSGSDIVYPADGTYYMDFRILKDGTDSDSIASQYVYSTALVKVKGGQRTVMFTVMQSAEVKSFTLNGQKEKVVSRDTKNNTRVISFTVSSLAKKFDGTVRIDWDAFNYHHSYKIQFLFDEATAIAVTETNPKVPGSDIDGNVGVDSGNVDEYQGNDSDSEENEAGSEVVNTDKEKEEESGNTSSKQIDDQKVEFSDIEDHWAKANIEKAIKLGIVNGYLDGSFRPNGTVTRAEFAVMLSRALKLEKEANTSNLADDSTIPGWAKAHVARVIDRGIVHGHADATFRPNDSLTRVELAVMIARAANLAKESDSTLAFADADSIPAWAQKEVAAAVQSGLIKGKENNRFDSEAVATRAEALTLIIRLLDR